MEQKRGNFSGNLGFVLAAAGAAVGLGNIWKFPHLAGSSGGGLFIIIYLVLLAVMGIPLILAETAIGRRGQKDAMHSFVEIAQSRGYKNKTVWSIVGGIGVLISFIIFTYYPVVGGWVVEYMVKSVTVPLGTINMDTFVAMISTPWSSIIYTFIFFFAMYIIVVR